MTPAEELYELMSRNGVPNSSVDALELSGVPASAIAPSIERVLALSKEEDEANALLQSSLSSESAQPSQMSTKELMSSAILSVLPLLAGGLIGGSRGVAGAAAGAQEGAKVYTAGRLQENKEARELAISRSKILRDLVKEKSKQKGAIVKEIVSAPLDIEKRKAGKTDVNMTVNTGAATTLPVGGMSEEFIATLEPESQAAIKGAIEKGTDVGQKDLGDLLANDKALKQLRGKVTDAASDTLRKEAEAVKSFKSQVKNLLDEHAATIKDTPNEMRRAATSMIGTNFPTLSSFLWKKEANLPAVYTQLRRQQAIALGKVMYPGERFTEIDAERAEALIPFVSDNAATAKKKGEVLNKLGDLKEEAFKEGLKFAGFNPDKMFKDDARAPFNLEDPTQAAQARAAVAGGSVGQVFIFVSPSTGKIQYRMKTAETDAKTGAPIFKTLSEGSYAPGGK